MKKPARSKIRKSRRKSKRQKEDEILEQYLSKPTLEERVRQRSRDRIDRSRVPGTIGLVMCGAVFLFGGAFYLYECWWTGELDVSEFHGRARPDSFIYWKLGANYWGPPLAVIFGLAIWLKAFYVATGRVDFDIEEEDEDAVEQVF